jgi:hypothetical protein
MLMRVQLSEQPLVARRLAPSDWQSSNAAIQSLVLVKDHRTNDEELKICN